MHRVEGRRGGKDDGTVPARQDHSPDDRLPRQPGSPGRARMSKPEAPEGPGTLRPEADARLHVTTPMPVTATPGRAGGNKARREPLLALGALYVKE